MRLHSPQVQRQLRLAVQTALHASPKLAAEAWRQRKKARRQGNADYAVMRLFGTAWLVVMLFMGPLPYQLTALALWGLASVLTGGTRLASLLEGDQERQPLLHLPVADNLVCHRQGWKFLWLSLWLWADGLAGYGLLWWGAGSSRAPHWVWVPVLATLHWALAPELLDSRSSGLAWLCLPLAVLPGWGFVAAYVRRFNRGGVDLDSGNDLDLE